jgi:hypothetical protein
LHAARLKGARQLGAIGSLTAFDLDELAGNLSRATVEEIAHGHLLRSRPSPLRPWRSVLTR